MAVALSLVVHRVGPLFFGGFKGGKVVIGEIYNGWCATFPNILRGGGRVDGGGDHALEFGNIGLEAFRGGDSVCTGDGGLGAHDLGHVVRAGVGKVGKCIVDELFGLSDVVFVGDQ